MRPNKARIRQFVKDGGSVIADYKTSLYDETGKQRKDFGLADIFGCSYTGNEKETERGSFLAFRDRHEMLRDFKDTDILLNGGRTLICKATDAQTLCTLIPTVRSQPPEYSWIKEMNTDDAVITLNKYGKGQVVYFANTVTRQCLENGHKDFGGALGAAIDYCLGQRKTLETNAPPSVFASLLANESGQYVLSLVNHTAAPYRPSTELVPVRDIEARVKLKPGDARTFRALKAESKVEVQFEGDTAVVRVPELASFTSVALGVAE